MKKEMNPKRKRRFFAALILCLTLCTIPALAADDPLTIVNNLSDFIFSCIKAVGVIILGWGIVQVGMSVQSHDASQRSQGFLCLLGGLLIAFAKEILSAIGVDAVVFGSECGQIEILKQAAYALNHESAEFQERLRKGLKAGLTYPQARAKALGETQAGGTRVENVEDFHANTDVSNSHIWSSILNSPNNILGIEYLRAAEDLHSPMEFYTISREGSGYHEDTLADANFPSASAIRGIIRNSLSKDKDLLDILASHLPAVTHPAYTGAVPVFVDDFSGLLNATVLQMQATFSIADLSPELAARLTKPPYFPLSFEERIQALKTRQLTYTRVSRALLHLVLGMREEDISRWKDEGYALYARILGFRRQSSPLLSCLHKKSSIPLITKMADAAQSLAPSALALLEQEVYASHLYQTVRIKRGGVFQNEYTEGLVFV